MSEAALGSALFTPAICAVPRGRRKERLPCAYHRPPNAFILFSQSVRPAIFLSNPALNNIECTRIMARMWQAAPDDARAHFKEKAAQLQEDFKRRYPDYAYSKARKPLGEAVRARRPFNSIFPPSTWEIEWEKMAVTQAETDRCQAGDFAAETID
jgi:hypothetical protein